MKTGKEFEISDAFNSTGIEEVGKTKNNKERKILRSLFVVISTHSYQTLHLLKETLLYVEFSAGKFSKLEFPYSMLKALQVYLSKSL